MRDWIEQLTILPTRRMAMYRIRDGDLESAIQKRAYFIYLATGRMDSLANYYQAKQEIYATMDAILLKESETPTLTVIEDRIEIAAPNKWDSTSKAYRILAYDPDIGPHGDYCRKVQPVDRQPIVMSRNEFDQMLFNLDEKQDNLHSLKSVLFYRGNVFIGPVAFCQTCLIPFSQVSDAKTHVKSSGHILYYQDARKPYVGLHGPSEKGVCMPCLFHHLGPAFQRRIERFGASHLLLPEVLVMHHRICRNKVMNDVLVPAAMIVSSINMPVYILLWILEFLPHMDKVTELTRLRVIEKVFNSVHKVRKTPTNY